MPVDPVDPVDAEYPFAAHLVVRALGVLLVAAALVAGALTVAVLVLDLPSPVLLVGALVLLGLVLAVACAAALRPWVVRLDEDGFRVRLVRGAGVRAARWSDVDDAAATWVAGERCVVLRLHDGRTSTLPAGALGGNADDFVRDLQDHLDHGHGYPRFARPESAR